MHLLIHNLVGELRSSATFRVGLLDGLLDSLAFNTTSERLDSPHSLTNSRQTANVLQILDFTNHLISSLVTIQIELCVRLADAAENDERDTSVTRTDIEGAYETNGHLLVIFVDRRCCGGEVENETQILFAASVRIGCGRGTASERSC